MSIKEFENEEEVEYPFKRVQELHLEKGTLEDDVRDAQQQLQDASFELENFKSDYPRI